MPSNRREWMAESSPKISRTQSRTTGSVGRGSSPGRGIELALPTRLFDARYELDLDVLFRQCTPMGWTGTFDKWFQCMDLMLELDPEAIVPGA